MRIAAILLLILAVSVMLPMGIEEDKVHHAEKSLQYSSKVGGETSPEFRTLQYSYSGTLSGVYNKRLYSSTMTYPRVRVHRIYFSAGYHTVEVDPFGDDYWDDPGIIIYNPYGALVISDWDYNAIAVSFYASVVGYYYVLVYLTDDDTYPLNNIMRYDLYVDYTYYLSDVVYGEDDDSNPTISPYSIAVFDFPAMSEEAQVVLEWTPEVDDLDLYVFSPDARIANYSASTNYPEELIVDVGGESHYTILVHRYSAISASTDFIVNVYPLKHFYMFFVVQNIENGSLVSGVVNINVYVVYEGYTLDSVKVRVDDGLWIDITNNYNPRIGAYVYSWDTTANGDGQHVVTVRVDYSYEGTSYSDEKRIYVLVDNIPSDILIVDDDFGYSYEVYYIRALESLGLGLHDDFEVWNQSLCVAEMLNEFPIVIWLTGDGISPISEEEMNTIIEYLDSGGSLFISSKNLGFQWNSTSYYSNYFKAIQRGKITNNHVNSTTDSIYFPKNYTLGGGDSAGNYGISDALEIVNATIAFKYDGTIYVAGLTYEGVYKLVYFAFPFESINSLANRVDVMNITLNFLNNTGQPTEIIAPEHVNVSVFGDLKIYARLESDGTPLVGKNMGLYIRLADGWELMAENSTNSSGDAEFFVEDINYIRGTYELAIVFYGDSTYMRSVAYITLHVDGIDVHVEKYAQPPIYDSGGYITFKVSDEHGPIEGASVIVRVEGMAFSGITDSSGLTQVWVEGIPPGTYTITVECYVDMYHDDATEAFTIEVTDDDATPPSVTVETVSAVPYNEKLIIKASVSDSSGVADVTLYYVVDGETYSIPMSYTGGGVWEAEVPREHIHYGTISWYVVARDADNDWYGDSQTTKTDTYRTDIIDDVPPEIKAYSVIPEEPLSLIHI